MLGQLHRGPSFSEDVGLELIESRPGFARVELELQHHHLNGSGIAHGGALMTLADSACGWGCIASFPDGVRGFATIDCSMSFLTAVRLERVRATATLRRAGKRTQVWDAEIGSVTGERPIALFRCTQMLFSPGAA